MANTISRELKKQARREYMQSPNRILNQMNAYNRGRRVMLTIPNPNPHETNKRFIRVNAKDVWDHTDD